MATDTEKSHSSKSRFGLFKKKKQPNENVYVAQADTNIKPQNGHQSMQRTEPVRQASASPSSKPPQQAQQAPQVAATTIPKDYDPGAELPAFYQQVSKIKALLNEVDQEKSKLMVLHDSAKKMAKQADLEAAQKEIQDIVTGMKKNLSESNKRIQALQKMNETDYNKAVDSIDEDEPEEELSQRSERISSIFSMRATVTVGIVTKFQKTCDSFKEFESRVSQEYHDDVKRRLELVTQKGVSDEAVEDLIDSGEADQVFRKALMQNRGQQIMELTEAVEQRHEGMQKLYQDLLTLHQMMMDFSVLVYEQGKMIDSIADQVGTTADLIRKATDQLIQAKKHKKTKDKFKSAAAITAGGAAAAGVGYVALSAAGLLAPLAL